MSYSWPPTLDEAKAQINAEATTNDAELLGYIDAATSVVENIVGPVASTAYTDVLDGGGATVMLANYPVVSVESVTEYASGTAQPLAAEPLGTSPYTGFGYVLEADIGRLTRTSAGSPCRFAAGQRNVVVAYHAGRASVPADVRLAALFLVEHMWEQTQRGDSSGRPTPGLDVGSDISYGPNRESQAMALLEPHRLAPKVA